ncbi:MAG: J domain-containing protein [Bacteroidota bacterium]
MQNYYEILGVPTHAAKQEIRKAYLAKCKAYHPDLHEGAAWAENQLKLVNEAYEVLSDSFRRHDYDAKLIDEKQLSVKRSIPSIQEIRRRPVWMYGSLLALALWLGVIAISFYEPQQAEIQHSEMYALKNEHLRFQNFCKKHPKLINKAEYQFVLHHQPATGFTFELERLLAKGDTIGMKKRILELREE